MAYYAFVYVDIAGKHLLGRKGSLEMDISNFEVFT
jgi:hypothetical protein